MTTTANAIYVIEHLEPKLWEWCEIEYKHISKIVGKDNLLITNIKSKEEQEKLKSYARVKSDGKSIREIKEISLKNVCILDPEAEKELNPEDAKSFDYFIFGGILGDFPARKRTEVELTKFIPKAEKRNIGNGQFPTDNAVYVVKQIASGIPLSKMKFKDEIEVRINKIESTIFPFRYVLINNKPLISKELIAYLKKE